MSVIEEIRRRARPNLRQTNRTTVLKTSLMKQAVPRLSTSDRRTLTGVLKNCYARSRPCLKTACVKQTYLKPPTPTETAAPETVLLKQLWFKLPHSTHRHLKHATANSSTAAKSNKLSVTFPKLLGQQARVGNISF